MCHRDEVQKTVRENLDRKLERFQPFIREFFTQESAKTSNCYYGYIKNMLQWMIDNKKIYRDSIYDIVPDDMNCIKPPDIKEYFDDLLIGKTVRKNSRNSLRTKIVMFSSFWDYLEDFYECVDKNVIKVVCRKEKKIQETGKKIRKSRNTILSSIKKVFR